MDLQRFSISEICRLCAQNVPSNELVDLNRDFNKWDTRLKLLRLNSEVDFDDADLPSTVCYRCCTSLQDAYEFVLNIDGAQTIISSYKSLCMKGNSLENTVKICENGIDDDNLPAFNDNEDVSVFHSNDDEKYSMGNKKAHKKDDSMEEALSTNIMREVKVVPLPGVKNCYLKLLPIEHFTGKRKLYDLKTPLKKVLKLIARKHLKRTDQNIKIKTISTEKLVEESIKKITEEQHGPSNCQLSTKKSLKNSTEKKLHRTSNPRLTFNYNTFYLKHVKETWKDYKWQCSVCKIHFTTCNNLITHSMQQHGRCNTFSCSECDRKSRTLPLFIDHVWKYHRQILKQSCHLCFKPFYSHTAKINHNPIHFDTEFVCPGCNMCFKSIEEMDTHKKEFYEYSLVSQTSTSFKELKQFEGMFKGLTCLQCDKTLKSVFTLIVHLRTHTVGDNSLVCEVCGKVCTSVGALHKHMIGHSDLRPLKCDLCFATFKRKAILQKHLYSHNKEKRFPCETCGKQFHALYYLKKHKKCHSDVTPFMCRICNRGFRLNQFLRMHMRRHTGEKPYGCESCDIRFTYYQTYKKHMATEHGIDVKKKKQ